MHQPRYTKILVEDRPGVRRFVLVPIVEVSPIPVVVSPPTRKSTALAPLSLMQYVRDQGGLNPDYDRGNWQHELRMVRESCKGLMPGVLSRKAGKTMEEMATIAHEAGYIPEPEVDVLLYCLSKDAEAAAYGERRNRVYGHDADGYVADLDYQQWAESIDALAEA